MDYKWEPLTYQDYVARTPNRCPRCGMGMGYHELDPKTYPCIRTKPYKLGDHTDLRLGMQVWYVPMMAMMPIKTGFVANIFSRYGPSIRLWKLPAEQTRMFDLTHEGLVCPRDCFATSEGAEARFNKLRRNRVSSNNIQANA